MSARLFRVSMWMAGGAVAVSVLAPAAIAVVFAATGDWYWWVGVRVLAVAVALMIVAFVLVVVSGLFRSEPARKPKPDLTRVEGSGLLRRKS